MASVAGLLVDNNYDIKYKGQVTPDSVTTFTNKNSGDQSNFTIASSLWSASGTNAISIRNGPSPIAGQSLVAISPTVAEWKSPSLFPTQTQHQTTTGVVPITIVRATNCVPLDKGDGSYYIGGYITSYNPSNPPGATVNFEIIGSCIVQAGVVTNVQATLGGSSGATWSTNPVASASGLNFVLSAGDNGQPTMFFYDLYSIYHPF